MGGAVSTGRNNDDLVGNLVNAEYIRSPFVEKLFRSVDRADYFLPDCKKNAYKDLAWKSGNLHLSAPCIYSEVMEGLCLQPNLSFLNLGSGTGYLSTMVGLAIGSGGINHGIEIYSDVIEYANRKLEEFKRYSCAIDEYDFCEPKFIQGNCLCLSSDGTLQYDRVYCGGSCPAAHINYMKNLIKVKGILIMPVDDQLMQMKRTSETSWEERSLLPVSFATLILPSEDSLDFLHLMDVEPSSLQEICRTVVRNVLRSNINKEYPKLKILPKKKRSKKPQTLVTKYDTTSDEDSDGERISRRWGNGAQNKNIGTFIDIVLGRVPNNRHALFNANYLAPPHEPQASSSDIVESDNRTEPQEIDNNLDAKSDITNTQESDVNQLLNSTHIDTPMSNTSTKPDTITEQPSQNPQEVEVNTGNGTVIARIMIRKRNRDDGIEESDEDAEEECNTDKVTSTTPNKVKATETPSVTKTKREKFDSGLGDEIVGSSSDGEATHEVEDRKIGMDIDSSSSSDEDIPKNTTNEPPETSFHTIRGRHWRTVTVPTYAVDHLLGHIDDDTPEEDTEAVATPQPVVGPYSILMRKKIQELPLPQTLKNYLNYYKEF